MKKFITDLLRPSGKWSFKRVTAMYILNVAIGYAFLPVIMTGFNVQEFVFWGFLTYSAAMIGMVLKQKMESPVEESSKAEESLTFNKEDE